jgi:tRNA (cytidine/uridine-2'-O-)-methyltransferase
MLAGNRSLNLANAAAIVVYEAWRQVGFAGATSAAPWGAVPAGGTAPRQD